MIFKDAIDYIRADQERKIRRTGWAEGVYVQWFTTPEEVGFKDQNGSIYSGFTTVDILAEDWETA